MRRARAPEREVIASPLALLSLRWKHLVASPRLPRSLPAGLFIPRPVLSLGDPEDAGS